MALLNNIHPLPPDSPRRWFLLHWLSFCTTVTGVLTLLFARGHYSIDVVLAYWVTTRIWWIYHTMANNPEFLRSALLSELYIFAIKMDCEVVRIPSV